MQHALGIDLGGTKTSLSVGTFKGRLLAREVLATPKRGLVAFLKSLAARLEALAIEAGVWPSVRGVGVAVAGLIDPLEGRLLKSPNLPQLEGLKIASALAFRRRLPVYVENDANAAAWAEKVFGSARKWSHFMYITLSTGIGGGLVLGGKLYRGIYGAGEVGHMVVRPGGPRCSCGLRGCLEAVASGTAIARQARAVLQKHRSGILARVVKDKAHPTALDVEVAARRGDPMARSILCDAAQVVGQTIGSLLNLLNLERVVLGGGVARSPEFFWSALRSAARRTAWRETFERAKIVPSSLGDAVGDLGALSLVVSPP